MSKPQITIIGGGLVGAAIGYGAARSGARVRVLDQGDVAFRASRGNFGLVWVSTKGRTLPRYSRWSRQSAESWPGLHDELLELTGVDSGLQQPGGFWVGFSEADVRARAEMLETIDRAAGGIPFKMMSRSELREYLPGIGPTVVGGSFGPLDGHASPLMLLRALHAALQAKGADVIPGVDVKTIRHDASSGTFTSVASDGQSWKSERVVLAAGLGNANLAPQVGLRAPLNTTRGQMLITERLKPFLDYPTDMCRQTGEGTVQIGVTFEDVGLDEGTTTEKIKFLARQGVATFPALAGARMVRAWGALRPLTPDGCPIYEASTTCPHAYLVACHSGVSLAAVHAFALGPWVSGAGPTPPEFEVFSSNRFANPSVSFANGH